MRVDALVKEVLYGCGYGNTACNSMRWPCVDRGYGVSGSKPFVVSICVGGREELSEILRDMSESQWFREPGAR
jgi:hypothetical protein